MSSVFDQDSLKVVKLKPCPFCGDTDVSSYVRGGFVGIVECPCGAQMTAELPQLERDDSGHNCLSALQIQMLERFRKNTDCYRSLRQSTYGFAVRQSMPGICAAANFNAPAEGSDISALQFESKVNQSVSNDLFCQALSKPSRWCLKSLYTGCVGDGT